MSESLAGRVFFAGEATTYKYPATMHGAFISGLREAANVVATIHKKRRVSQILSGEISPSSLPQAEGYIYELLDVVKTLEKQFQYPTLQSGSLKVIFGADKSQYESVALVQLDLGKHFEGGAPVYFVMFRDAFQQLLKQPNEDARMKSLTSECGIKLVNRTNVGQDCLQILQEIIKCRSQVVSTNGNGTILPNLVLNGK
eukprot:TRINITY_DN6651_c0_g1_i12.p5 TRINITY_DN6651_c0_g1~~TRINITY_DN6651_c0_g1_i12.p5  ORF type:complete len:199 (-),score=24.99 TRINITY_DN6651_c0_g1_i12:355-951(-)